MPDSLDASISDSIGGFGPEPLTPTAFLDRAANAYASRTAVVDGGQSWTYSELLDRSLRLSGALRAEGVKPGDRVSVLAPNTHVSLECHFGVPGSGAVLNALNTRLSADELAHIVDHAGSTVLIYDSEMADVGRAIIEKSDRNILPIECGPGSEYEQLIADAEPFRHPVEDEQTLLSLNYTSGTTGNPKGVMYSHHGAYLQSLAMAAQANMAADSVFLWTLPMFHCNGWCFPWAVTAVGGVHVGLREVRPKQIWKAIHEEGVTHFNGAPTVLTMLANHEDAAAPERQIKVATGGAPPSPSLLERMADLNIDVTHLYGLTETYGPAVLCDWWPTWSELEPTEQAKMKSRQGVSNVVGMAVRVVDDEGHDVPNDGETQGEVVLRGNNVMLGYYNNPDATKAATVQGPGGAWFRTGDVGVLHPDNYLQLKDRAKDIIISGGENIASIEVEQAIDRHPKVIESAVVAKADEKWGEIPVAFVSLRPGEELEQQELIDFVKSNIARYKAPKEVFFVDLPKTSTGKIQKHVLRSQLD